MSGRCEILVDESVNSRYRRFLQLGECFFKPLDRIDTLRNQAINFCFECNVVIVSFRDAVDLHVLQTVANLSDFRIEHRGHLGHAILDLLLEAIKHINGKRHCFEPHPLPEGKLFLREFGFCPRL